MSNRRGGPGGRNKKANKGKQSKGGGGGNSSNVQIPKDEFHNLSIPCCRLLYDVTRDIVATEGMGANKQQQQTQRRPGLLAQMLRSHLLEQRRKETTTADSSTNPTASSSSTPSKKRKKRKRKKQDKNTSSSPSSSTVAATREEGAKAARQEADETDSAIAITSTVSQDSQQAAPAPNTPKEPSSTTSPDADADAATNSSTPTATATTVSTTNTTTTSNSNTNQSSSPATAAETTTVTTAAPTATPTTPVDLYLDRVLAFQQQAEEKQHEDENNNKALSSDLPVIRDMEAFLNYLNEKYSSTATRTSNKGISITQQELEQACHSIDCPHCKEEVLRSIRHQLETKQPIVLPAISFSVQQQQQQQQHHHHHNGLAVPIHNQKPNAPPPPAPSMDFDYVAMEEGSSPMGTLLEAKADLAGIPYFHPHLEAEEESKTNGTSTEGSGRNSSSSSSNNKKQNKKGPNQMEWHFVSSSSPSSKTDGTQSSQITLADLQHVVKDIMLPLALPPDELVGARSNFTNEDVREVQERVHKLEEEFRREMDHVYGELQEFQRRYDDLEEAEDANGDSNLNLNVSLYHDIDDTMQKFLEDIVLDVIWDRLLYMSGNPNMSAIRPTSAWESMVAYLTDQSAITIMGMMQAVESYEYTLENEIASSQGKIPEMFVHKGHRIAFRNMLGTKLRLMHSLFETVQRCSEIIEEVWPMTTSGSGGFDMSQNEHQQIPYTSGLLVHFRRKFFAEQEFYRKDAEIQQREEAAAGSKKAPPSSPANRVKKDAEAARTTRPPKTPSSPFKKWVQTLDVKGQDLLAGLIEFAQTVKQGRIADIKEEHMIRCQKLLGLLTRVGEDCISPLVNKDPNCTTSYTLTDPNLMTRCRDLWTQIQQQGELQQQEQLLASGDEGPSILDQKHTVAKIARDAIRLLRHLRKTVTESHGPKTAAPIMPLSLVATIVSPHGIDLQNLDLAKCSYNSLVCGATVAHTNPYCAGGSGQPRLTSLFLALFYRKLSEHCSEWHAELAEQELLTTMGDGISGVEGMNGSSGADPSSGNKKDGSKKKKKKPAPATETTGGSVEPKPSSSATQSATETKKDVTPAPAVVLGDPPNLSNGHQKKNPDAKREQDNGNDGSDDGVAKESSVPTPPASVAPPAAKEKVISTVRVDKKMGVVDHVGAFQSAESYLVGRLTAMLNASGLHAGGKKTKESSGPVIII